MNYKVLYKVGNLHWLIISSAIIKSFKLNKSVVLLCLIIKQFQYNIRIQTSEFGNKVIVKITYNLKSPETIFKCPYN